VNRLLSLVAVLVAATTAIAAPKSIVSGLKNPESVAVGADGRVFVTVIGEFDKDGDGGVMVIKDGQAEPFAMNMNDPKGMVAFQQWLFVTDKTRVRRIDTKTGKVDVWADETDFPTKPQFLNDVAADQFGKLYVSDSGDLKGGGGAIFSIASRIQGRNMPPARGEIKVVADGKTHPFLQTPNGLLCDSLHHLLVLDFTSGELNRLNVTKNTVEKVAEGFPGGDGLCFDRYGRLFITSWKEGKVWSIPRPGEKPVLMAEGMEQAADLGLDPINKRLIIPDMKAGTVVSIPTQPPGWEVDETPLPIGTDVVFSNLKWTDWDSGEASGKVIPLRPIVLTHAGDGSNRTFVATQHGVIHIIPNEAEPKQTKVFLDIQSKVFYRDNENEQGLLGLAFHPKYKENGEFFVFYTDKSKRFENIVCRYRVSKTDPNKADPNSEEELLRVSHKYWNHDGGTICFGPDGCLYIVLGDGGSANDPDDHGQKMSVLLGKILRIDINGKGETTKYAIPRDNPFVGVKDARPEIYALGVRNPWRLAFDRKTGQGWFGEVGQDLWEEVNLLEKGANYGWRRRESLHPFWPDGTGSPKGFTEPIWEYHHDVGKSITGGHVYRGKQFPELDGMYLYADYVSGKVWAMKYDETKKRVTANRPITSKANLPIMSFGEDEKGEVYLMTYSPKGQGLYGFVKTK
jgi:glucose/arabinose dehydrogenase